MSRSWCVVTRTSGLSASRVIAALSTLGRADPVRGVQHLPLQVGEFHDVAVHDAEFADARRGQVERGRRAQAAGPDAQDPRLAEPLLALEADLRQANVPRIALQLRAAQGAGGRRHPGQAGGLPGQEAAGQGLRLDAVRAQARDRQSRSACRWRSRRRPGGCDPGLQTGNRLHQGVRGNAPGAVEHSRRDFVGLAHVDQQRAGRQQRGQFGQVSVISSGNCGANCR